MATTSRKAASKTSTATANVTKPKAKRKRGPNRTPEQILEEAEARVLAARQRVENAAVLQSERAKAYRASRSAVLRIKNIEGDEAQEWMVKAALAAFKILDEAATKNNFPAHNPRGEKS